MMQKIGRSGPASRFGIRALFTIIMLLAIPVALHAQAYYGSIVGNVTDSTGAAVLGAKITATANATDVKSSTTTSGLGTYSLAQLAVGTYTVRVDAPGFKEFIATGVEVHVSTNTSVNVTLQLGAVSEKVTVQADEVQVETTSAAAGEVVTGAQVRELPLNGENFVGLTQLSPGVSAAASFDGVGKGLEGGVNFSVNGNPYTNNLFLVDGVNNNDVGSNRTILVYPAVDTIAEFKMIRNSFGAEYGQASGAVISITTKSGQNQFHGGFFYSGRNDKLDANDFFSNHNDTGKAKERKNDYGYNVSGPVKKDKLFVWWNQEWDKEIQGSSFATCNPTVAEQSGDFSVYGTGNNSWNGLDQCKAAIPDTTNIVTNPDGSKTTTAYAGFPVYDAATNPQKLDSYDQGGWLMAQFYPTPNFNADQTMINSNGDNWSSPINNPLDWSEWNVRPDFDINKSNRATFRWTQDSWVNNAPNNPSNFWGESSYPTIQSNWSQPSKSVMAKLSSTISNSMVNDVEFGLGNNAIITTLAGTRAADVLALATAYPASFPSSLKQKGEWLGGWGGLNPYGSSQGQASMWNIAPYKNHEDLYTVQDNLSKVKGNHLLKAGAFYSNNIKVEDGGNGADRPNLPGTVATSTGYAGVDTSNHLANILVPGAATSTVAGYLPQGFANVSEGSTDATAYVKWHDFEWYLTDSYKVSRNLSVDLGFRWSFFREPYGNDNHWANWSLADWTNAEALAAPGDACNGLIIVPGTTPCANAVKLMASLGVGITLSSGTPGSGRSLTPQNSHDIAPRVGISWDIFGNGKTALRLGGGQFYQRELVGLDEGAAKGAPFVLTANSTRTIDTASAIGGASVSPNWAKLLTSNTPNSWQWNITVEQEMAKNTTLEVAYVGNTGLHLTSMMAFNPIPQSNWLAAALDKNGTGVDQVAQLRPAWNFGQIQGFARQGHATYHSMQALFRSQMGASTFQAAYTWSHSIGDVEMDNSSGTANQEAATVNGISSLDKGNTNINRPNIFVMNEVYYLPKLANANMITRSIVGGWQVNSILTFAHGSSLTAFANGSYTDAYEVDCQPGAKCADGTTNKTAAPEAVPTSITISQLIGTGYNGNNRPLLNAGQKCNSGQLDNQILNTKAFTLAGYQLGSVMPGIERRGSCWGAQTLDVDGQLAKNWEIREKYRIKFSMDFFDLFNRANFNTASLEGAGWAPSNVTCGGNIQVDGVTTTAPCSTTNSVITTNSTPSGWGQAGSLQSGKGFREIQYGLKFSF
jgi:hypothetical protein